MSYQVDGCLLWFGPLAKARVLVDPQFACIKSKDSVVALFREVDPEDEEPRGIENPVRGEAGREVHFSNGQWARRPILCITTSAPPYHQIE